VPTSWAIAGTAESAVLASSTARLPVKRVFIRDGITHSQKTLPANTKGKYRVQRRVFIPQKNSSNSFK